LSDNEILSIDLEVPLKKYTVTRFIFAVILWISQIALSASAQQPQSLTNRGKQGTRLAIFPESLGIGSR
jgi:hypothetical protein